MAVRRVKVQAAVIERRVGSDFILCSGVQREVLGDVGQVTHGRGCQSVHCAYQLTTTTTTPCIERHAAFKLKRIHKETDIASDQPSMPSKKKSKSKKRCARNFVLTVAAQSLRPWCCAAHKLMRLARLLQMERTALRGRARLQK